MDGGHTGAPRPTISHMFGEVAWVLSQSRLHKHFSIGDLEWMVMPPILANQFRVFHQNGAPFGFAIWAYLSEEGEQRLLAQVDSGMGARLRPEDWKAGDRLWLIELVTLEGPDRDKATGAMMADLIKTVFAGKSFKFHAADTLTGKREIREISG